MLINYKNTKNHISYIICKFLKIKLKKNTFISKIAQEYFAYNSYFSKMSPDSKKNFGLEEKMQLN